MKKVILLTILVFSLIATGCLNQKSDSESQMSDNKNISSEIIVDEPVIDYKNQNSETQVAPTSTIENIQNIEDWRIYEKKDQNVKIKYHKNWYYDRDEQAEKELGYNLFVGFAESPEILAQGAPYPIEFIVADKNTNIKYNEYLKIIATKNNKQYILKAKNKGVNGDISDKMAENFEFIDE